MFTIIGGDGKEYGPVTLEQVKAWIAGGRANLETQARRAGEAQWQRLGDFPEFSDSSAPQPPPVDGGVEPVNTQPEIEFIDAKTYADELFARSGKLDIGGCLERGWNLYKANFWPLVGVTLLIMIVQMAIGMIPFIGSIAGMLLKGVIIGGLYYYYIGKLRNEPRELGDAFAGFSKGFGPLLVASLLTSLIIFAIMATLAGPVFFGIIKGAIEAKQTGVPPEFHFGLASSLGAIVAGIILFDLSVSWMFTFALVIDKGIGAWSAMEVSRRVISKQWFHVFAVALLGAILAMLGLFALIIGVIFTTPLYYGALISAYEALCNPPGPQTSRSDTTLPSRDA